MGLNGRIGRGRRDRTQFTTEKGSCGAPDLGTCSCPLLCPHDSVYWCRRGAVDVDKQVLIPRPRPTGATSLPSPSQLPKLIVSGIDHQVTSAGSWYLKLVSSRPSHPSRPCLLHRNHLHPLFFFFFPFLAFSRP